MKSLCGNSILLNSIDICTVVLEWEKIISSLGSIVTYSRGKR